LSSNRIFLFQLLTKSIFKMEKLFKYFGDFFTGLTALVLTLLGLGVAVEILFGSGAMFGVTVIENVTNVLGSLAGSGFAGFLAILILFSLIKK